MSRQLGAGRYLALALALSTMLTARVVYAQGCTQCRDNVQAVQPRTQGAYRTGIAVLAGTALVVVAAATFALRRAR